MDLVAARTKSIPDSNMQSVYRVVKTILERDFWDEKKQAVNQSIAAEKIGVSQATLSDLYNRKPGKGAGLSFVIALADYAQMSLDEIVGRGADETSVDEGAPELDAAAMLSVKLVVESLTPGASETLTTRQAQQIAEKVKTVTAYRRASAANVKQQKAAKRAEKLAAERAEEEAEVARKHEEEEKARQRKRRKGAA